MDTLTEFDAHLEQLGFPPLTPSMADDVARQSPEGIVHRAARILLRRAHEVLTTVEHFSERCTQCAARKSCCRSCAADRQQAKKMMLETVFMVRCYAEKVRSQRVENRGSK